MSGGHGADWPNIQINSDAHLVRAGYFAERRIRDLEEIEYDTLLLTYNSIAQPDSLVHTKSPLRRS